PSEHQASATSRWTMSAGADLAASAGSTPSLLAMGALFGEAARMEPAWPWRTRLSLTYGPAATGDVPLGHAQFSLGFLSADECPWRLRVGSRFSGSPCVTLEVGRMHAQGVTGAII